MAQAQEGAPLVPRVAFVATVALLAGILTVAAQAEEPVTSPRTGRRLELVELIRQEQRRATELEARVDELSVEVARYESLAGRGADRLARVQARIDEMLAPAGFTGLRGRGVVATLTDSSLDESPTGNLNDLVIHEQDLQAVINALWVGGAEGISVNGQRILATTAIRCVGNTLLLHGGVYSPPYVIAAIGDDVALQTELDRDVAVTRFRTAAQEFKLGFSVTITPELELPAYDGTPPLSVAQPAEGS